MKTSTVKGVLSVVPPWAWVAVPVGGFAVWKLWPMIKKWFETSSNVLGAVSDVGVLAGQGIQNILDLPKTLPLMLATAKGEAELAIYNAGAATRAETFIETQVTRRQADLLKSIKGDGKLAGEMARDWTNYARAQLFAEARSIAADFTAVGSDVQAWIKGLGIN